MVIRMTIKQARLQADLTQQQMSELLEIPLRTIVSWESESQSGRKCPVWAENLIIEKLNNFSKKKKLLADNWLVFFAASHPVNVLLQAAA